MKYGLLFIFAFCISNRSFADNSYVRRLYERLTGIPLLLNDPRVAILEQMVADGRSQDAVHLITDDPEFLQVTVRDFAMVMSNHELSPYTPLNDFVAMVVGVTRDGGDARELLTGDFRYVGLDQFSLPAISRDNDQHYEKLDELRVPLKSALFRVAPQWPGIPDAAGLLTTRAWAVAHMSGGTNRRALQYAFQEFLCRPIPTWKDVTIPDDRIRCDVSRAPSGNPEEFRANCRGCHAPMDALAGAFSHFDAPTIAGGIVRFVYLPDRVAKKTYQNSGVFPFGYTTQDDSWENFLASNATFGWNSPNKGRGVNSLGN